MTTQLTGGSSPYYKRKLADGYVLEALDVIEAFEMNFAEGNIFKALWRRCMGRLGDGKPGTTSLYDAEKLVFFSERELDREQRRING